jgi:selenocysteine lyase/cysteine desulfurase
VQALDCDVFICSAYKFCGPHVGLAYGKHELLESWRPYKAIPAAADPVGRRFEVGTAPYELLAGFSATIAYLESIGGMPAIAAYERELGRRLLDRLPGGATVYGLPTMDGRVATFLLNLDGVDAADAAKRLADRGFGVWAHDTWFSLGLRDNLEYPDTALRVGLIHYNTADEIDRFCAELAAL